MGHDRLLERLQQRTGHLPAVLRERIIHDWQSFVELGGHEGLSEKTLDQLVTVWGASPQSARYCLREPGLLREWQLDDGGFPPIDFAAYAGLFAETLSDVTDQQQAKSLLRQMRNREMLRIAWRDIAGLDSLDDTLIALSTLADAMCQTALDWLTAHLAGRFGYARGPDGEVQKLIVIGMGKLGGQELNFSSDIDLIFAYRNPGMTDGARSLSHEEYFRRLAQELVTLLSEMTADGFVFRVDARLRPFGSSGPLAIHLGAMEQYYQSHGREWERYAWIKARPVAGDIAGGESLLQLLQPFVYRRYLDFGAFDAMREMKVQIEQQIKRKGLANNIKLGAGGIREIEFIAQVFQLIHGGRHIDLRRPSIREVLPELAAQGLIPEQSAKQLDDAYVFLRRLENRLQAYADQQTHVLPEKDAGHAAMALAMGYPDWHATDAAITAYRKHVHEHFERVFSAYKSDKEEQNPQAELLALWQEALPQEVAEVVLAEEGFEDAVKILESLDRLRDGIRYHAVGEQSRRRLDRCVVMLIAAAAAMDNADRVMERLIQVLRAIAGRSSYVALLVENPMALAQLVRLCASSPWITAQISQSPMLLDSFLAINELYDPPLKPDLLNELSEMVAEVEEDDVEEQMNILRRFKQTAVLRVAAADVSETMPLMIVSDRLTDIAEVVVKHALEAALAQTVKRHGEPCMRDGESAGLLVVAYGKFGGIELGYGSDLDLVFIHDAQVGTMTNGERAIPLESFFIRVGQRLIHWLNTYTPAGRAYEVDMRLRPSGQSGLLVTSFDALQSYQHDRAWTWEHQALVRARPVAGKAELADRFLQLREQVLCKTRDPVTVKQDVIDMRHKMRTALEKKQAGHFDLKQAEGGIADIEFIVQYNVLRWAAEYPELVKYPDNIRILSQLETCGLWDSEDAGALADAYRTLRRQTHRLALQELPTVIPEEQFEAERKTVLMCWEKYLQNA